MAAKLTIDKVDAKIEKHEAICAERWRETIYRIKRLEILIIMTLCSMIGGMASILTRQVF